MPKTLPLPRKPQLQGVSLTGGVGGLNAPVFTGAGALARGLQPPTFRAPRDIRIPMLSAKKSIPSVSPEVVEQTTKAIALTAIRMADDIATKDADALAGQVQNQLIEGLYEADDAYFSLEGEAAYKGKEAAISFTKQVAFNALENVSPAVKAKAFNAIQGQVNKYSTIIASHAITQKSVYDKEHEKLQNNTFKRGIIAEALNPDIKSTLNKIEQQPFLIYPGKDVGSKLKRHQVKNETIGELIRQLHSDEKIGGFTGFTDLFLKELENYEWGDDYGPDDRVVRNAISQGQEDLYYDKVRELSRQRWNEQKERKDLTDKTNEAYENGTYDAWLSELSEPEKMSIPRVISHYENIKVGSTLDEHSQEYRDLRDEMILAKDQQARDAVMDKARIAGGVGIHIFDMRKLASIEVGNKEGKKEIKKAHGLKLISNLVLGARNSIQEKTFIGPKKLLFNDHLTDFMSDLGTDLTKIIDADEKEEITNQSIEKYINDNTKLYAGFPVYKGQYSMRASSEELIAAIYELEKGQAYNAKLHPNLIPHEKEKEIREKLQSLESDLRFRRRLEGLGLLDILDDMKEPTPIPTSSEIKTSAETPSEKQIQKAEVEAQTDQTQRDTFISRVEEENIFREKPPIVKMFESFIKSERDEPYEYFQKPYRWVPEPFRAMGAFGYKMVDFLSETNIDDPLSFESMLPSVETEGMFEKRQEALKQEKIFEFKKSKQGTIIELKESNPLTRMDQLRLVIEKAKKK